MLPFIGSEVEAIPRGKADRLAGVATGDFDGDGLDDLAALDEAALEVLVRRAVKKGDGVIFPGEKGIDLAIPGGRGLPADAAIADLNGDGKADIAVGMTAGDVLIFLGNGEGRFSESPGSVFAALGIEAVRAADLDGDGGGLEILYGSGAGTQRPAREIGM